MKGNTHSATSLLKAATPLLRLRTRASLLAATMLLLFAHGTAFAGSATWDLSPRSGDWNTATNWMPVTVPNGPVDTASFGPSRIKGVSISADTEVKSIVFNSGASAFTITASPGFTLTISDAGITNNSGVIQNFVTAVEDAGSGRGFIVFSNGATAGALTAFTNNGGGPNTFLDGGGTFFFHTSTAGNASFVNNGGTVNNGVQGGSTQFFNTSSAGNGTFTTNGGAVYGATGGFTKFFDNSTAGNGTFTTNGGHYGGRTIFFDNSTAGNGTFTTNGGAFYNAVGSITEFFGSSTAGNGTFTANGGAVTGADVGSTEFFDSSTADHGTFTTNGATFSGASGGHTEFHDSSTADHGMFIANGGAVNGAFGGLTEFEGHSTAGNGTFTANGGAVGGAFGGFTDFRGDSTAGNGTFTANGGAVSSAYGGSTRFFESSTAGNATLTANGGSGGAGTILFFEISTGGTARVEVFGNGNLDISPRVSLPGVTVGSIEGNGNVLLGFNNLTVGSNNLSTTFSGMLQDGGVVGGTGGSLTKIGTGTLILSGANTYTGNTNINGGVLRVDGSIASPNTFVNPGGTLSGTGTVGGNVSNGGVVAPGDSPGTLHVVGSYSQGSGGALDIEIASLLSYDQLIVSGAASLAGTLDVTLDGYTGHAGDIFTILMSSALSGNFATIDLPTLSNGLFFKESRSSNDVFLTVNGPTSVPDQGSTLLLMVGALAALLGMQRFWVCVE